MHNINSMGKKNTLHVMLHLNLKRIQAKVITPRPAANHLSCMKTSQPTVISNMF